MAKFDANATAKEAFQFQVRDGCRKKVGLSSITMVTVTRFAAGSVVMDLQLDLSSVASSSDAADSLVADLVNSINSNFASVFPSLGSDFGVIGVSAKQISINNPPAPSNPATPGINAPPIYVDSGSKKLSGGAIAGIVIGSVAGVAIIAAVVIFFIVRRRKAHTVEPRAQEPAA